jgi:peptidoglycan hydrolase CwlO-like protein
MKKAFGVLFSVIIMVAIVTVIYFSVMNNNDQVVEDGVEVEPIPDAQVQIEENAIHDLDLQIQQLENQRVGLQSQVLGLENTIVNLDTQIEGYQDQVEILNGTITALQGQLQVLDGQISGLQDQRDDLIQQLADLQQEVGELETQVDGLTTQQTDLEGQVDTLTVTVIDLTQDRDDLQDQQQGLEVEIQTTQAEVDGLTITLDDEQLRQAYQQPSTYWNGFSDLPAGTRLLSSETVTAGYGFEGEGFYLYQIAMTPTAYWEEGLTVSVCGFSIRADWNWHDNQMSGFYVPSGLPTTKPFVSASTAYAGDWINLIGIVGFYSLNESQISGVIIPEGFETQYARDRIFVLVYLNDSWRLDSPYCD